MAKRPTFEQRLAKADKHIARRDRLRATHAKGTLIQQSRRKSSAEKARFHEIDGAGRSRIKRPFFELNAADEDAVFKRIADGVDRLLKESR